MSDLPKEHIRRERTNQFGYVCPTENAAIRRADRGVLDTYTAPAQRGQTVVMRRDPRVAHTPTQAPKDENLKRVRCLYSALCSIAGMMDMSIEDITIKAKGEPRRYKTVGEKKTIERVEV